MFADAAQPLWQLPPPRETAILVVIEFQLVDPPGEQDSIEVGNAPAGAL